jgi:ubiquinone/menaquinone biosynthesis C-methylase UbiE
MRTKASVERMLNWYVRVVGGGDWPFLAVERRYLGAHVAPGAAVVDVGGGDGRLANVLARKAGRVYILDRETTLLPGADRAQYAGALTRAMRDRRSRRIAAVKGDASSLPFTPASLGAVVSSQLLEHIDDGAKTSFFHECARVLAPGGVLAISTPNSEFIARHRFRLADGARAVLPKRLVAALPKIMRGVWLEQDFAAWERSVGHYDHGCRLAHLRGLAAAAGFEELDARCLHTRLTAFWFELLGTFPLLVLIALPLVRVMYWLEATRVPADGINLMITLRKRVAAGANLEGMTWH